MFTFLRHLGVLVDFFLQLILQFINHFSPFLLLQSQLEESKQLIKEFVMPYNNKTGEQKITFKVRCM